MLTTRKANRFMQAMDFTPRKKTYLLALLVGISLFCLTNTSFAGDGGDIFSSLLTNTFQSIFGEGKTFWRLLIGLDVLMCSFLYWKTKDVKIFSSVLVLSLLVPFLLKQFVFVTG